MTKDELREALHREMLFYYFAQREPQLEIRTRALSARARYKAFSLAKTSVN